MNATDDPQAQETATEAGGGQLDIAVEWPEWLVVLPEAEDIVRRAVTAALPAEFRDAELCVVLTDDHAVRHLNARFRGQDKATNVLSFPVPREASEADPDEDGVPVMLGDVVIALETVCREAEAEDKLLDHHLSHLVVHGVLHLIGYDHDEEADADAMESRERAILATLDIPDPYAGRDET